MSNHRLTAPTYLLDKVVELGPELDAGGSAADDDDVEEAAALLGGDPRLQGHLEVAQQPLADRARVRYLLEERSTRVSIDRNMDKCVRQKPLGREVVPSEMLQSGRQ